MAAPAESQTFAPLRDAKESKLFVNVMEARNLRASGGPVTTRSDPFVVVKVGSKILQTSVQQGTLNPVWNETFIIPGAKLAELYQQTLEISVQDKAQAGTRGSKGAVLGTLKVPLSRVAIGEEIDLWFELEGADEADRDRGQLHMVLQLEGPFRTEFKMLERVGYFIAGTTDKVINTAVDGSTSVKPYLVNRYTAVVAVLAIVLTVLAAPLLAVLFTVGLPVILPVVLVTLVVLLIVGLVTAALAAGSQPIRNMAAKAVAPVLNRLRDTPVGQQMLYQTGPRPSVEAMLDTVVPPEDKWTRLVMSLTIDTIGASSLLLPIVGDVMDIAWAPVAAVLLSAMYHRSTKHIGYIAFVEEILPFTDIIPTATLAWIRMYGPGIFHELKAHAPRRRHGAVGGSEMQPEITAAS